MKNRNVPDEWIDNLANWATLGGVYLGIDGIALAYRDNGSVPWAVFCFFVAYLSAIKLWDMLFRSMGDEKKTPVARLLGGCIVIVLFTLGGLLLGLFRFSNLS